MEADKALSTASSFLEFVQHWPDLFCVLAGTLFAYLFILAVEAWYLPTSSDPVVIRRQKWDTFIGCWGIGAIASIAAWWAWDPIDTWPVRIISCVIASLIMTFIYPPLAAFASSKLTWFNSAWAKKGPT